MITKIGLIEIVILIRIVMWLLATRLGTLLLCGSLCFCEKWPFVCNFSAMPLKNREEALKRWSKNKIFTFIRVALASIRILSLYVFFSRVLLPLAPFFTKFENGGMIKVSYLLI